MTVEENFIRYISSERNFSKNTIESYSRDLRQYCSYLRNKNLDVVAVEKSDIEDYKLDLLNKNVSAATIARKLATLRAFYRYICLEGHTQSNPTIDLKSPKIEKKSPETLTPEEIEKLLNSPDLSSIKGARDRAIIELLYATGMKVSEVIDLNINNINYDMQCIVCSKDGVEDRNLPLNKQSVEYIKNYVEKFRERMLKVKDEQALFLNYGGKRLTRQGFWKIIKSYAGKIGIEKDLTPKMLRHSFASHMLKEGVELSILKERLGYADISSTQIYTQMIEEN